VAPEKTEAILFRGRDRLDFTNPCIRIRGSLVRVSPSIKYLGVMLNSKLNFRQHFKYVDIKVGKITRALGALCRIRGARKRKRGNSMRALWNQSFFMRLQSGRSLSIWRRGGFSAADSVP